MGPVQVHRFRYAPGAGESLAYGGGIAQNLRRHPLKWGLLCPFLAAEFNSMVKLTRRYKIQILHAHWALPQGLIAVLGKRFLGDNNFKN